MVKTRLGKTIGMERAAEIYKKLAENTVSSIQSNDYDLIIAITPAEKLEMFNHWLGDLSYITQTDGDLGKKMQNAFEYAFEKGYNKCIVAGSDIPELDKNIISEGFAALDNHDTVAGRAQDGGYYLIGMKRKSTDYSIFSNMIWSTDTVLTKTVNRLSEHGKNCAILKTLDDIDTEEDFQKFGDRFV
ncbi:MAG: TIGR04282 family arsenosugar biosynthesis glycosyltransferase [Seleniivibrio sp.]|nr:TIGR04282 family arsenosugar biosynthesis glycosyltransferase [Seleniivibrio sp.]